MRDLEPLYSSETNRLRKPRTVELYDGLWRNYLLPAFGGSVARGITVGEVVRMHRAVGDKHRSTANRLTILLAHFFRWAQDRGHVPKSCNPARGVEKYDEQGRERYLKAPELARLGNAIRRAETEGVVWRPTDWTKPNAKHAPKRIECRLTKIDARSAAALRLLIFTGARLREILNLRWSDIDLDRGALFLPDSKTGRKTIVLGNPAILILRTLQESAINEARQFAPDAANPLSPFVFPSSADATRPKSDIKRPWALVLREAQLEGLRLHDLRHTFASIGAGASLGLPLIGALLGHADTKTTAKYAHLDTSPLRRATDSIGSALAEAMGY